MDNKNKGLITPIVAGALSGITLGWVIRNYSFKRRQLEGNESIIETLKSCERKIYEDGLKRANEIEGIKEAVRNKVVK